MLQLDGTAFDLLAADPVSPTEGQLWFNTTLGQLRLYRAGAVKTVNAVKNTTAPTAPTITDGAAQGYELGSRWIDTTTQLEYVYVGVNIVNSDATWLLTTGVAAGSIGVTQLADNLDLSANGSTKVGDFRGNVQATSNGTGTVAGAVPINASTTIWRITAGSPTQFQGITTTGRADGSLLFVYVISGVAQFNHEVVTVAAADRFNLPNGTSWYLSNGGCCFIYDATSARWKLFSTASIQLPSLATVGAAAIGTTLNALTGLSGSNTSSIRFTPTAQTADLGALDLQNTGTFNATAAARAAYGLKAVNTATRSAGANDLTNYGVYGEASGGQVNYAGYFQGNVSITGNALIGNDASDAHTLTGTLTLNGDAGADGEVISRVAGLPTWTPALPAATPYRETAASTTLGATDGVIVVTGATGAVTISLPAASAVTAGRRYTLKDGDGKSASQPITIARAGADTIDGDTSVIIKLAFGSLDLCSNGVSAWRIL